MQLLDRLGGFVMWLLRPMGMLCGFYVAVACFQSRVELMSSLGTFAASWVVVA